MDTSNAFGLSLIGFDEQQRGAVLAVFYLAETKLNQIWAIVDLDQADFFLFAMPKQEAMAIIVEKQIPFDYCLFYTENEYKQDDNEVLMDSRKIPRLFSLTAKLNQIAKLKCLASGQQVVVEEAVSNVVDSSGQQQSALSDDQDVFIPEKTLLHSLSFVDQQRILWSFDLSSVNHTVFINLVEKNYYYSGGLANIGLCLDDKQDIAIDSIAKNIWDEELEFLGLTGKPLNNLVWYIVFKLSNGRLLQGHSAQDIVYLTRWPDLSIPECGRYVKLAAFMRNNAVSLIEVAKQTGFLLSDVYNFYNACYLIDIVEKADSSELRVKTMDENKQQLLEKINHRLQLITRECK